MPWFMISYDFSPVASQNYQDFDGLALRYGWDRYRKFDDAFSLLPNHTLTGEFTDYTAARSNLIQLCSKFYQHNGNTPINIILIEILRSTIIADPLHAV